MTFAVSAVALAGAAGLAIDVSRLQSTKASLQQVADSVCRRIVKAPIASYSGTDAVIAMAKTAATTELNESGITRDSADANLLVEVTGSTAGTKESYTISISENSPSSLGQVVGYSGTRVAAKQTCERPLTRTPPPPGDNSCSNDNYIYVAAFSKNSPPAPISASALEARSDQTVNQGYIATIIDNATSKILSSQFFSGGYSYSAPASPGSTMTLYIQDVNADGSYPCNQLPPQQVSHVPPPSAPPPGTKPKSCDYTQYNHDTVAVKSASHKYWGGAFQITPDPSSVGSALPKDVVVKGVTKPGYQLMKVTLSPWFVPNNSTMVNFNDGGSSRDAKAQDDYLYNAVVGKLNNVVSLNGDKLGGGASGDGTSPASSSTPNKWRLVHVFNGTEGVWEDTATGECFNVSSPIVLDLIGLGRIETTGVSTSPDVARVKLGRLVSFDAGEGDKQSLEWLTGNGQGFLVDNRDGRAALDMNRERLFGSDGEHVDGYEKLAALDRDGKGVLKGADLDGLAVWIDNGDGVVQPGEIQPLAALGVTELSVRADWVADGEGHRHLKSFAVRDGKPMLTEDVWLGVGARR